MTFIEISYIKQFIDHWD